MAILHIGGRKWRTDSLNDRFRHFIDAERTHNKRNHRETAFKEASARRARNKVCEARKNGKYRENGPT